MKRALGFMNKALPITYNTYIGGVSATIGTAALLATKLGISVGAISNFAVVGSDIKCRIVGSYDNTTFFNQGLDNSNVTYFKDNDGLINDVGHVKNYPYLTSYYHPNGLIISQGDYGNGCPLLELAYFPNATTMRNNCMLSANGLKTVYIPKVITLGNTTGQNDCFYLVNNNVKFYLSPVLATCNGGSPDGDIVWMTTNRAAIVRYVTNFTAPNPVTTLAAGTIYNTAIQLNFTAPSSTNAIEYYECYTNGVFKNNITASGQYITGLTPSASYNFTVIAVDIFYNKSVVSNSLSATTTNVAWDIATGLVSYYKLDEITGTVANDIHGAQHLTNTGITINQGGKIGNSYLSTAGSQHLNSSSFPTIATNISFNLWVYRTGAGTGTYPQLIGTGSYPANAGMAVLITTGGDLGWIIKQDYLNFSSVTNIPLNTWTMVTVTFDGSNVKTYINAVLLRNNAKTATLGTTALFRMYATQGNEGSFVGKLDEASIYNVALTQSQIDLIYNAGTGITL